MVAFMDGPIVLAGMTDEEKILYVKDGKPENILRCFNEREWENWLTAYFTEGQPVNIKFKPIYEVTDEKYTVYFPLQYI